MKSSFFISLAVILCLLSASCGQEKVPVNPAVVSALDSLQALVDDNGIPVFQYYYFSPQGDLHGVKCCADTTFSNRKPIVIHDSLVVAADATLTLSEGTTLMFHDGAGMDVHGRVVMNTVLSNASNTVQLSTLPKGIYLVHVQGFAPKRIVVK